MSENIGCLGSILNALGLLPKQNNKQSKKIIIDPRPNSIVKEYQDNFKSLNYDPKKRQVKIE